MTVWILYHRKVELAMTNYEKIIAGLTPEILAEKIADNGCAHCPVPDQEPCIESSATEEIEHERCIGAIVKWLTSEVAQC